MAGKTELFISGFQSAGGVNIKCDVDALFFKFGNEVFQFVQIGHIDRRGIGGLGIDKRIVMVVETHRVDSLPGKKLLGKDFWSDHLCIPSSEMR